MIFVLIFALLALAAAAYLLFERDIFSPPVALTAIFCDLRGNHAVQLQPLEHE